MYFFKITIRFIHILSNALFFIILCSCSKEPIPQKESISNVSHEMQNQFISLKEDEEVIFKLDAKENVLSPREF